MLRFLFVLSLSILGRVHAQTLSSSVVGSTGEQYSNSSGSLDWTMGEIMTETYSQNKFYLTQGFQQPATIKVTGLEEAEVISIQVYPNPARDILYIKTTESGAFIVELYNMQGQKLASQSSSFSSGEQIHQLSLEDFKIAVYLLRISNTTSGRNSIHKIEKY